jgi:hypothetical protein
MVREPGGRKAHSRPGAAQSQGERRGRFATGSESLSDFTRVDANEGVLGGVVVRAFPKNIARNRTLLDRVRSSLKSLHDDIAEEILTTLTRRKRRTAEYRFELRENSLTRQSGAQLLRRPQHRVEHIPCA